MKNWSVHWLEATGTLAPWSDKISEEISQAYTRIEKHVSPPHADILLQRSQKVITELGIGAFAHGPHLISLDFDPENENFVTCHADDTLQRLVAHEAHHCLRFASLGFATNLGEALVNEGLAGHFSRLVYDNPPEPWECALSADEALAFLPGEEELRSSKYDHDTWFFGTTDRLPKWFGYSLGYTIVARWFEKEGAEATRQVVDVKADDVLHSVTVVRQ